MKNTAHNSPLGKISQYPTDYNRKLLFSIPRTQNRESLGIIGDLPFYGFDIWQEYELSWLNMNGRPNVAIGQFIFPCTSPYLLESKSLKLYLHSLNNKKFPNEKAVQDLITTDFCDFTQAPVAVQITPLHLAQPSLLTSTLPGTCLDTLDIDISDHEHVLNPNLLRTEPNQNSIQEKLYSHLLKSNCPVTGQPDWGTVAIHYEGPKINHESFLRYLISYRNHSEFAENCVERIFKDIQQHCQPHELTIAAFFTRRGGKDINPIRSTNSSILPHFQRLLRQ